VVLLLLVLSTVRHLLALRETKRLYGRVESAAEERRVLLADVMQRADLDRHRVAAQLHEQATSSYVAFVSYLQATGSGEHGSVSSDGALARVRDDLAAQAESLRQLMLAIEPVEAEAEPHSLAAPINAFVDRLYGNDRVPALDVRIDPDLELDWTTETIVFRIIQEALRNVWRHADASFVSVTIGMAGPLLEVRIEDDGVGFDPDVIRIESGLASMRSFAAFSNGDILVESVPGAGTLVTAQLGDRRAARLPEARTASAGGSPGSRRTSYAPASRGSAELRLVSPAGVE
jgi:signal transduction histidine kinase